MAHSVCRPAERLPSHVGIKNICHQPILGGVEGKVRVLYVDDNSRFLETVSRLLAQKDGVEVITETDPSRCIDRLEDMDVDCVLSDYRMPRMDGMDFLRKVRDDHPNLPFILFTSKESEDIIKKALEEGATDYVPKSAASVSYELLTNRIERAVEHYKAVSNADYP